ncbi:MAG: tRNA pseudouridine(38-40) synthase TruA [Candidatus Latescibacteria bacterium]|nr:tRNA pseudouridine(38-40) synthase TruA [Candidatus Latescibacterota bacterium]
MPPPTRTLRLLLEYQGTDFAGWQIQAQGRTVQGELARCLQILLRESVCPIGAGRTDAGTHALGQVAHFHTRSALPLARLQRGLNGLLPPDIAVLGVEEAPAGFHARYSARSKRYRYRIRNAKSALDRQLVWSLYQPLDLEPMIRAAGYLAGTHQFAAFCNQDPLPDNFICQIKECGWTRQGSELVFEIEADRFLRHMVRIMVGTMAEMGRGRRQPEEMAQLLESTDRTLAGPTAPAQGLCLVGVDYG